MPIFGGLLPLNAPDDILRVLILLLVSLAYLDLRGVLSFQTRTGQSSLLEDARPAAAGPPVQVAQDAHSGGDQENTDDRRVHKDGDGKAEADGFGGDDAGEGEGAGD